MSNIGPSLEDLLPNENATNEATQNKALQNKMSEIEINEKEKETEKKALDRGLNYIDLRDFPLGPDTLATLDKEISQKLNAVCFFNNGKEIRIGAIEINDEVKKLENELKKTQGGVNIKFYIISKKSFEKAMKIYDNLPEIIEVVRGVKLEEKDIKKFDDKIKTFHDLENMIQDVSLTEQLALIIASAIKSRASDIHIEAEEKDVKIRFRIDGVLNDAADIDKKDWPKIISRIKQLAKLKINISDQPQDGRFSIFMTDDKIDVRVSALPTAYGESVVMRLLMSSATKLEFSDLGLDSRAYKILEKEIKRPNGLIVTTGPTGSGKTTTLYAILKQLNTPKTKIVTIEDPVEYELKGINQSQVNKKYGFAQGLKSIVRQDPDIIMVGEIRDLDTAEISIQAALTGHLVLSTIHTNDAFGTIPRFLSLGAKSFLLAPALNAAIGQRLVRKLCEKCKNEIQLDEETKERVNKIFQDLPENYKKDINISNLKFYSSSGCDSCQGLGYKGRIGIYEIMPVTDKVEKLINQDNVSEVEVKELAKQQGVATMIQDGLIKASNGITSVDEVFRVTEE